MNYSIRPYWDQDLLIVFTLGDVSNKALVGLAYDAVKLTTGAPDTLANRWLPSATVRNVGNGVYYLNTGTTASPVWKTVSHS